MGPPEAKRQRVDDDELRDWTTIFDAERPHLGDSSSLQAQVVSVMKKGGFRISSIDSLARNIAEVEKGYRDTPYHNFAHATHVFLNSFLLLNKARINFTEVERAAMLYSAIIHDYGHEGVTNMQLVKEGHPLSVKYDNISVAENFSIEAGLALLEKEEFNFLGDFTVKEFFKFKFLVKTIVLATDIGNRDRVQKIYADTKAAVEAHNNKATEEKDELRIDINVEANRITMLSLIMKMSDVGGTFQHSNTSKYWIHNFYQENVIAGNHGRGPSIEADKFLEDQQKFFKFYIQHLLAVVESSGLFPVVLTDSMDTNVTSLMKQWGNECESMLKDWAKHAEAKVQESI